MLCSAAFCLHCLPDTHLAVSSLQWVKISSEFTGNIFTLSIQTGRPEQTVDPAQTLQNVASDVGLHCLLVTHLAVSSLQ